MAFMAALESDLRALSAEARRRYPAVKDAAEHAILKLRMLSTPSDIAQNEDIMRIFLMACDVKSAKLSVISLSCLQKLISHDAISHSALKQILGTLKEHAEITDENVQLKTLQTVLIIFQAHLHLDNEENLAKALGVCLRLLENNKSSDSVRNTAAATFRQAVALIFDDVVSAESLPIGRTGFGNHLSRTSSVINDVSRSIKYSMSLDYNSGNGQAIQLREELSSVGELGLRLLEDLTALAAGGSASWLHVHSLQRTFCLDILEFVLSNYVSAFQVLAPYQQLLRHQVCSLLMTSLRTNAELEGEVGEPSFRRLVLRSVAHVIRIYSSSLVTECEVFLNMLLKVTCLDLPLWHRILVLEILRGFCVEARTLRLLFQTFDMEPKNTNVVENMVKALARVVSAIQIPDTSEESLAAVAGMFSSKAKGVEWSMDYDSSNAAVLVASEAHAITLAVEGLLGVVFTIATLTDEAVDMGEIESPKCEDDPPFNCTGKTAVVCLAMVDSTWLTILDALSLILTRSQGEAIILEILKGYQAFTQACGVLRAVEPLNSFLASLCKFTISIPSESEKRSGLPSPVAKRSEPFIDQRESIVLTPKNVQALRTLFNIAHRLHSVLGPSWVLVLETLAALDRVIHSPHASTQEVSTSVPKVARDSSAQNSDIHILSLLNSQLFESSALMHISAVKSLLYGLRQLSNQFNYGSLSVQQASSISFSMEGVTSVLQNNLHRVSHIWDKIVDHLLELANSANPQLRSTALTAFDRSVSSVLGSDRFTDNVQCGDQTETTNSKVTSFECTVLSSLRALYNTSQYHDVRVGSLKILLHILERHGEKLYCSWPEILGMLRSVAAESEKDLVALGFQSIRVIMNDGLSTIPVDCLNVCINVTGAYGTQRTDINISLTAIGLLWTASDVIARGLVQGVALDRETEVNDGSATINDETTVLMNGKPHDQVPSVNVVAFDKLLFSVFAILQELGADERPEVRNSSIRTLFQIMGSLGHKLSQSMWEDCLWNYVFPILDNVSHMAARSSRDEWQGKELGTRGGKAVHMLIHHSRNTAQKQWDETLVMVLGGITRILRSHLPFLLGLNKFSAGWDSLLHFIRDSILNGSKEVALAANNCLQTIAISHCPKGSLPLAYLKTILNVYLLVVKNFANYNNAAYKVKQEILQGIGDIYVQAQGVFQHDMYLQLLLIFHLAICQSKTAMDIVENDLGAVSPVQRTILEILPILRPADHLSPAWPEFLQRLFSYLPVSEGFLSMDEEFLKQVSSCNDSDPHSVDYSHNISNETASKESNSNLSNIWSADALKKALPDPVFNLHSPSPCFTHLFGEKLLPVLISIFIGAPASEKCIASPEIIQALGRCMLTRRDYPNSKLWRVAVEGFIAVLLEGVNKFSVNCNADLSVQKYARARFWKEAADVYEIFLVGSCGRALSSDASSAESLNSDESLEMALLNVLGEKILKANSDVPVDSLQRLVSTLDRCASRTGSLPLETVGLLPSHCSRFSLCCLQTIFSLCSSNDGEEWHPSRSEISRIAISFLLNRCKCILDQFLTDENGFGGNALPSVRVEEIMFVLQELAQLVLHTETALIIQLPEQLKEALSKISNTNHRTHLLFLFPSLTNLVISREKRVRESVGVLLKLIAKELGFS